MEPEKQSITSHTYTYAPNWYRPQCMHIYSPEILYYASNYILYEYDVVSKSIKRDLSFRAIALKNKNLGLNAKNIKIQAIVTYRKQNKEEMIVVALNQKYLGIIKRQTFQVEKIVVIEKYMNGASGLIWVQSNNELIIWDDSTSIISLELQKFLQIVTFNIEQKMKQITRVIIGQKQFLIVISNRGQILILSTDLKNIICKFTNQQINLKDEHILAVDLFVKGLELKISILSKNKNMSTFVHCLSLSYTEEEKKFMIKQNGIQIHTELKIIYPKIMFQKIKAANKAAMTVKFIDQFFLLITGKLGEHFIFNLRKIQDIQKEKHVEILNLKPHSIDNLPEWLHISQDSKHYKQIYAIYGGTNGEKRKLFMVGTDQILSQWQIVNKKDQFLLKSLSTMKFLTSEASSFFSSEADPKTLMLLLRDGIVRSCCPISPTSYYLQEHWKFTKKFKIVKAVAHPLEPGIIALVTECGKILVYDIYQDRLMRIIELDKGITAKNIINITFQYVSIMKPIQLFHKLEQKEDNKGQSWKQVDAKINNYFFRQEDGKVGILVQTTDTFFLVMKQNQEINQDKKNKFRCLCIRRVCKIERIHNTKLWDEQTLIFSQNKGGILKLWVYFDGKFGSFSRKLNYNGSRFIYKIIRRGEERNLLIFQFKNKKICMIMLSLMNLEAEANIMSISQNKKEAEEQIDTIQLESPLFVEQMVLDFWANQLIIYNQKEDTLGYLNFQNYLLKKETKFKFQYFHLSSKIQTVSFYEKNHVAIAFKDQSIKILNFEYLRQKNMKNQEIEEVL